MVATYIWEDMCQLHSSTSEYYKEEERPFNIRHRRLETLNMTLEDEMPIVLWAPRWYIGMPTSQGRNFCI